MTLLRSNLRRRPFASLLILASFAAITTFDARQSTPLAPGLEGILTYVIEDGSYVAVDAGRPHRQVELPHSTTATSEDGIPGSYTSPDGRYVAAVRQDEDGTHLDITNNSRLVRSYWLASPSDPTIVVGPKSPARAVDGVPLAVAWAPNSESLAFGSVSGAPWSLALVSVWSWIPDRQQVRGGYVGELAWSPDSTSLAISTY